MQKLKPSKREVMNNEVRAVLRATQERKGMNADGMAKCLGNSHTSYYRRFKNPEKFSLETFREIIKFCDPTDEEVLKMVKES